MYNASSAPSVWDRNRILLKGMLVGLLILLMLIPGCFISNLVGERQQRQEEVVKEVSGKWSGPQTITGPVLRLPYREYEKAADGKVVERIKAAYFLPDDLHVTGSITASEKKRSLYSVMLYRTGLRLTGSFGMLPLSSLQIAPESVIWQDARVIMSVGDMRGIEDQVALDWNGTKQQLDAGIPGDGPWKQGLSTPVTVNPMAATSFSIALNVRGSDYLYFTPIGKTTEVYLSANWKDPAFDGQYLPTTSDITAKDFKAHWKVLPLSHSYPQCWKDGQPDLDKAAFGVRLIQPVDGYSKTNRSVKYAILFIALTFTFFFFLEIVQKRQVHPLQYILVGIALTIFYALLLSISEYTGFNIAYLIASVATISLIGMYAWSMFRNGRTALGFTAALSALYGYIFILIQSEDYALLFGSIGLFIIIAIIMYYSRKVDWYGLAGNHHTPHDTEPPAPPVEPSIPYEHQPWTPQ